MSRPTAIPRSRSNKILLLCQGKTEEIYFKSFPVVTASREWSIRVEVESHAVDPEQLVDKAIKLSHSGGVRNYNSVWCVFDKDDFKQNFRSAIKKADVKNIQTAFSIESFELWLLLHFQKVSIDSPLDRKGYIQVLDAPDRMLGYCKDEAWQKENLVLKNFSKHQRDKAIQGSKELERHSKASNTQFQKQNCTIHKIVEFLGSL
ncbi:RloB family protein [Spirochaeta dissipatitropha]